MKAKEAILMSKLNKKKDLPTATTGQLGALDISTDKVKPEDVASAEPTSAKGLISTIKVSGGKVPSANSMAKFIKPKQEYEAQVEMGPTEVKGYSPVSDYLKKLKGGH